MEDAHIAVLDLFAGKPEAKDHPQQISFFGVFDGHGGDKVALYTGENIHNIVAKEADFQKGNYKKGLEEGFALVDKALLDGTIPTAALVICLHLRHTERS